MTVFEKVEPGVSIQAHAGSHAGSKYFALYNSSRAKFYNMTNVSRPVVRPTDETHTRCDTNGYLQITHDRGRCNGIEMISQDSLNKSSLFRYFILYVV